MLPATAILRIKNVVAALALAAPKAHHNAFLHFLFGFGIFGVFMVSIVDSSFVPLPLPGITDIMVVVLAAEHTNIFLLVGLATAGSALGGYLSYQAGHAGGLAFLEKHVPAGILKSICGWMESHAILAVALPAILPPPMPLSPFVLAAGAVDMSRRKFLSTFTISRAARHAIAGWLGIRYGRHIIHLWNSFSAKWAVTILIVLWTVIIVSCAIAFWKLYRTSRSMGGSAPSKASAV